MSMFPVDAFNGLSPLYVPMEQGLFLNPSRIQAPIGSLSRCRNFEVVNGAYEETQGLTMVGPVLDEGLDNYWHMTLPKSSVAITGTISQGDVLYWYRYDGVTEAGTGRVYYYYQDADEVIITIDKVSGSGPRRATKFGTNNGASFTVTTTGDVFKHASQLDIGWADFKSNAFLGAMTAAQKVRDDTWDQFTPDPLGVNGISGVFQFQDNDYAVRDFWGGRFKDGANEPQIGNIVEVDNASAGGIFQAHVGGIELFSGSWEGGDANGVLYLYPSESTTLDMDELDNWDNTTNIVNRSAEDAVVGTTLGVSTQQFQNKGLLWKHESNTKGWKLVDTGYSLSFEDGEVAPVADIAPLLTTDKISTISSTGFVSFIDPATSYGTGSTWTNLDQLVTDDGTSATSTIASAGETEVVELQIPGNILSGEGRILGIEVKLQLGAAAAAGTNVTVKKVQLRNDATGATQYLSANRAANEVCPAGSFTDFTFGGQLDTWELDSIEQEDLIDSSYTVLVQFENSDGVARDVYIDVASVNVHYALTAQKLWFYNGTTDVSTAVVHAYQLFDGEWSTDDAQGWMSLYDVSQANAFVPGLQIRTASGGGGTLIATTRTLTKNFLPSMEEMADANSIYQSRRATFSGFEDAQAVYVATGASPAFTIAPDGKFSFIRLPIDRDKDRPRYVEFHRNHLILAVGSHFMVSAVGAPNNFYTYDGATSWNPKDRITGMAAAPNGTTMVACEDSIHSFTGSGASGQDSFALKLVTDNSGALDYTLTHLLGNIYVDYSGITTADISDKFGGFTIGRRSRHIRTLMKQLVGSNAIDTAAGSRVIGALPVRKKNQYRIYMSSGDILTATFPEDPAAPLQFTTQHYTAYAQEDTRGYDAVFAPTALDSSVTSNGEERILLGTQLGHVMRVDPQFMDVCSYANKETGEDERLTSMGVWKFFKFIDLTPLHAPDAGRLVSYKSADIYIEHGGFTQINHVYAHDYRILDEVPKYGEEDTLIGNTTVIGDYSTYIGRPVNDYFTWYMGTATDGLTIRLSKFGGSGVHPLRIGAMHVHAEAKGTYKDRVTKGRGYEVKDGTIPQDIVITGLAANTVAVEGSTGSVTFNYQFTGIGTDIAVAGSTGSLTFGPDVWTFDSTTITFDSTAATFDGTKP